MNHPKRIMLITRNLAMGGIQKLVVDLANNLSERGHEVHIVYMKRPLLLKPNKQVHIHFLNINLINRLTIIGFIYDVFARLVLRTLFPRSTFLWRGVYGSIIFKIFLMRLERRVGKFDSIIARGQGAFEHIWMFNDKKFYQFIESPLSATENGILNKLYAKARFSGKNTIAISNGVLESANNYFQKFKVKPRTLRMITNPLPILNIQTLAEAPADFPTVPYIINVARFCPQKNQQLLLHAFALTDIPHKLVLVGAGEDEKKIKKLISQLGIEDRVIFAGEQQNPYPWMRHADLFVLSSLYEGFGLVIVESLACGTPVVASDSPGGIRDILIEAQVQYISKPNPEDLAEKIKFALSNPVQIKEDWYMRFDINKIVVEFINL